MKKVLILAITVFLILVGVSGFSYQKYNTIQHDKKVTEQKEQYSKRLAETSLNVLIEFYMSSMIVSGYSDVWRAAIDDGRNFNKAITNYKGGLEYKGILKVREDMKDKIKSNMKLLQNPPKEYKSSYNELKKMYGTYIKMVDQAIYPSGSLIEFNRYTGQLASEFEEQKEQFEINIPADVKKIKKELEKKVKSDYKF